MYIKIQSNDRVIHSLLLSLVARLWITSMMVLITLIDGVVDNWVDAVDNFGDGIGDKKG